MTTKVKTTERGWRAHFIGAADCRFSRNTLVECGDKRIVVSTIGAYAPQGVVEKIAFNTYYETMVFKAKKDGVYWDANVTDTISVHSNCWVDRIGEDTDLLANNMHETVVKEVVALLSNWNHGFLIKANLNKEERSDYLDYLILESNPRDPKAFAATFYFTR